MKTSRLLVALLAIVLGTTCASAQLKYYSADYLPLYGKATDAESGRYERLPSALKDVSRPDLYQLGQNSAGLYIRFRTNSSNIQARWESPFMSNFPHMSLTGVRGLDLYVLENGTWRYLGLAFPSPEKKTDTKIIYGMTKEYREYMLYLSLYDGVENLEIGIDQDATMEAPQVDSPRAGKPIVFYGSSILQGGCCSRPGMVFTSMISRELDREVINLGFSGNARLDMEIAHLMAEVKDPAMFILDNVPNCSGNRVREATEEFFWILRKAHPDVPVLFIDLPFFGSYGYDVAFTEDLDDRFAAESEVFEKLKKQGVKNIYYIKHEHTVGTDNEAFVDGVHFTDLGMMRYKDHVLPVIRKHMLK